MFIKNSINQTPENDMNKNISLIKSALLILSLSLIVLIIINTIQLFNLIDSIKKCNNLLESLSTISSDYTLQNELKTSYTIQLVKIIFILIAEFSGLILSTLFNTKINDKNDSGKYINFNALYDNLDEDSLEEELSDIESNNNKQNKQKTSNPSTNKHKK